MENGDYTTTKDKENAYERMQVYGKPWLNQLKESNSNLRILWLERL